MFPYLFIFRMLNASNLNLTRIAGKPIFIANKAGVQGVQRPNIIVTDGSNVNNIKRTDAQTPPKTVQVSFLLLHFISKLN